MLDFDHQYGPVTWPFERADPTDGLRYGRVAIDIHTDDDASWATAADWAESLGATRVSQNEQAGARWIQLRDPDGNPFRVFAPRPQ